MLIASHMDAKSEQLPWILRIKEILEKNGQLSLFINEYPNEPNFIHEKLHQTLVDTFHQNAFATIRKEGSKLRNYALFKTKIGMEKYLVEIKNISVRIQITKFRISDHELMIEVGRHKGLKQHLRLCPFCQTVETKIHFLLDCSIYKHMREPLLNLVHRGNPILRYLSKEDKFSFILVNSHEKFVADFIYKSFELRTFLSMFPKSVA